ncbi:MAG: winged helix-turn-helix transcriptional regulator [Firmicutes bacterium]|nr:winged helix-turn-helix transcriptional regulator [Bacillota bacterium]
MPPVLPLGAKWSEKFFFKYSPAQEMVWSLHVLGDPSHHQELLDWALQVNSRLAGELAEEIRFFSEHFDQWGVFIELIEAVEGEKVYTWEQAKTELSQMGQALFVYFALGRAVKVGDLLKVIRQPALIDGFLKTNPVPEENREVVRLLLLDPEGIRTRMLRVFEAYWDQVFSKEMARLKDHYFAKLQEKVRLLQESGPDRLLDSLGLGFHLVEKRIEGEALIGEEVAHLMLSVQDVERIIVTPTVFATPHLLPVYKDRKLVLRFPLDYPAQKEEVWETEEVLAVLKALADGTRLKILQMLAEEDLFTGQIAEKLGFSEPTISRHMKLLKGAGLVETWKKDNYVYYSLQKRVLGQVGEMVSQVVTGFSRN